MTLLKVEKVGVEFGGIKALDDISFMVSPGEIFALIGPNGAGKTTLFNIISGVYSLPRGRVMLGEQVISGIEPWRLAKMGLSRTFQNLQIFGRMSAIENVMVGRHLHEKRNVLSHLLTLPSVLRQNRDSSDKARMLMEFVGLTGSTDRLAGSLSYGELKRLEIARALATEPRLILLDEPAAGCNPAETDALAEVIKKIAGTGVTIVLIEHDMKLVMQISDRIHVLNQGKTLAEGTGREIMHRPEVISAYLGEHGSKEALRAKG